METPENKKKGAALGLIWVLMMMAVVVALLAAANRVPSLVQQDFPMRYGSIEEAGRKLGIDALLAPAYFPEGISWPPSLILGQGKPFKAVVMEFKSAKSTETALVVIQSSSPRGEAHLRRITLTGLKEETGYSLKGKTAVLQVGTCDNGTPCSRMTWQDRGLYFTVLLMSPPFELIRIAESMVR